MEDSVNIIFISKQKDEDNMISERTQSNKTPAAPSPLF